MAGRRKPFTLASRCASLSTPSLTEGLVTTSTRPLATTSAAANRSLFSRQNPVATFVIQRDARSYEAPARRFSKGLVARFSQLDADLPSEPLADADGPEDVEDTAEGVDAEEDEDVEDDDSESSSDEEDELSDYSELDGSYTPTSFDGISTKPFPAPIREKLLEKVDPNIVEIKPDGYLYLPEIQYRRILNNAFGPGGWALMPRSPLEHDPATNICSREYALYAFGRFISQASGEQALSETITPSTATEAAKSQALMRCCKDLGVASELWEPTFIREWKKVYAIQEWVEHSKTGKKTLLWRRKDRTLGYPWKEAPPLQPQQHAVPPPQPAATPVQRPAQTYARAATPQPAAKPAPAAVPQPPQAAPARPAIYTPYKSYATRVSTTPTTATRPVYAPKPIPGSPAAAAAQEPELADY